MIQNDIIFAFLFAKVIKKKSIKLKFCLRIFPTDNYQRYFYDPVDLDVLVDHNPDCLAERQKSDVAIVVTKCESNIQICMITIANVINIKRFKRLSSLLSI
ncbi:hypothetical protein DERP_007389 [Dermatophagoides pteronyssinus]|uniref:Uncharacterized protein n=1 Tax=Dermatophagoides pteronyssinus TaxID=6956 RepID=A0ABQ8J4D0_DERPT|nr:hypothetical protein DERP_007389 [Dermatophagoides pteronyssinus]